MDEVQNATDVRKAIVSFYRKALYCYAIPFGFLGLQVLMNLVSNFTYQPFLALYFLSVLPLGILGVFFTKRGFVHAANSGDREKKDVGYSNFILGVIIVVAGLLGLAFAFVMTG